MNGALYAVYDLVAQAIVGTIFIQRHPAAAIRTFADVINDPQTSIAAHPEDYELRCLGYLNDKYQVTGHSKNEELADQTVILDVDTIITGKALKAAQDAKQPMPATSPELVK